MKREFVLAEAKRVFAAIQAGGTAILAMDVAYAIAGNSRQAIEKSLRAKERAAGKRNGCLGSLELSRELQILNARDREMIEAVVLEHNLPITPVAPFRQDHPYMLALDPWVRDLSTKDGTMSLLLNGGPLMDALAPMCLEHLCPIVGSSANISLHGSNFLLETIEPQLRAAADVETDFGLSKYWNPQGLSSTIIAFPSLEIIRFGVCYEKIRDIFKREFNRELPERPLNYVHKEQLEAVGTDG